LTQLVYILRETNTSKSQGLYFAINFQGSTILSPYFTNFSSASRVEQFCFPLSSQQES